MKKSKTVTVKIHGVPEELVKACKRHLPKESTSSAMRQILMYGIKMMVAFGKAK